jgi:hypothetical protein
MYEKGSKISKVEEERFYFNNQKLIRWIGPNDKIVEANLYRTKEKEMVKDLNEDVFKSGTISCFCKTIYALPVRLLKR